MGIGRPKLTWTSAIQKDMKDCGLFSDFTLDCVEWQKRIHVPTQVIGNEVLLLFLLLSYIRLVKIQTWAESDMSFTGTYLKP